jgi:hypothetical protein
MIKHLMLELFDLFIAASRFVTDSTDQDDAGTVTDAENAAVEESSS